MSKWPNVRLGDMCDVRDGTHDSPKYVEVGYPLLTSKNFSSGSLDFKGAKNISPEDFEKINKRSKVDIGDIVMPMIGTIGSPVLIKETPNFAIKNVALIKFKSSSVSAQYIHAILSSSFLEKNLVNNSRGGTQKFVSLGDIRKLEIPVPPLEEQKRIAGILDQADSLRRKRQRALDHLNQLSQAIFHEMFGDSVNNEKKWKKEKLKNLAIKISSGSTPIGGSSVYVKEGVVFLRSQNVWRNKLELDDVVYIDEATHQKMKKTSLKNGDILITKTGRINTENSSLGRAAMFLGWDDSANINGHVYLIRLKPEVLREFVLYIITTREYREYIRKVCVGGIDKRQINKEHLEEFPIICPPIEKQKAFLKSLKVIEDQKTRFLEQSALAESLFSSLQNRAFKGEL
jgi:type I restriction enzyme S subunit